MRIIPALVASAIVVTAAPAVPANAAQPGTNGRIAYATKTGSNLDIFALKPTGESALRLTTSPADEDAAVYSPHGTTVTYTRRAASGALELWKMNADGSAKRRLLARLPGAQPQVSPDGKRIALTRSSQIWILNIDGSGLRQLTHPFTTPTDTQPFPEWDYRPVWSPDGKAIAYARGRATDDVSVFALRAASVASGADKIVYAPGPYTLQSLDWRPDGTQLVFSTAQGIGMGMGGGPATCTVETVWRDGTGHATLTASEGPDLGVSWSPDGQRIAYSHAFSHEAEGPPASLPTGIYTMRASDGGDVRLKRAGIAPDKLSWQATS